MQWRKILEHPLLPFAPSAGIVLALAAATTSAKLAPQGPFPRIPEMLGLLALGTLAALYRPRLFTTLIPPEESEALRPGGLGLATLVLPVALVIVGPLPTALLSGLILFAARSFLHVATRRAAVEEDLSWPSRSAEDAVFLAGAVLTAGLVPLRTTPDEPTLEWRVFLPAALYLVFLFSMFMVRWRFLENESPLTRPLWFRRALALWIALLPDALGWTIGTLLFDTAAAGGWSRMVALMAVIALIAAEAARFDLMRRSTELRIRDLERLQHAHKRILEEISGMGGIAQQILTECKNILPVQWFQFELLKGSQPAGDASMPTAKRSSWAAGPEGVLFEGEPEPEERPRALPGVHRRASWRILEKELRAEEESLAIVRLWCDPRQIEPGGEELFATLVPQMASSVHRAQLDREAKLDPLTGVPVRRLLESRLQRAYRLCIDEGWPMAVIMCDIDYFKNVNDTYGHAAGDEALKLFARTLDTQRREKDLCCRYGGEEFTLLLEQTNGEAALYLAERLRQAVAALEFEFEGQLIPLTFSSGVAAFPELHIKTASELLLLADEALYEAKEQGRNRCLLNLGRGTFRAPAGRTFKSHDAKPPTNAPRVFG